MEIRQSSIAAGSTAGLAEERPDSRTRILNEAERLFRHYGYSKTTVADIARELGSSEKLEPRFCRTIPVRGRTTPEPYSQ